MVIRDMDTDADAAHEMFPSLGGMEGRPVSAPPPRKRLSVETFARQVYPRLLVAIAALGMKTSFKSLIDAGWRPVVTMILETLWIAGLVLAIVEFAT